MSEQGEQIRDPQEVLKSMQAGAKSWQMEAGELAAILIQFNERLKVLEGR